MPRYLSVNSKFEPFSFQEKIAPLLMYKEEYDKTLSEYEKALAAADVLEVMKYSDVDADAYEQYKAEEQALQDAMNNFIDVGYNINTRKELWNAKERMNNLAIPMQAAYNRKLELIKEASANKDKSLEYFIDPNNVKVTDLMKNMGWAPQSFSKNELMNQGALISSGSSDLLLHGVPEFTTTADNKLLQRIQTQGFSDEDSAIIEALVRGYNVSASDIHRQAAKAITNVIKNTGVLDWEVGERRIQAINQAINSVMTGFNSKLGKETVNTISNPGYSKEDNGEGKDGPILPTFKHSLKGIANVETVNLNLAKDLNSAKNKLNEPLKEDQRYIINSRRKLVKLTKLNSGIERADAVYNDYIDDVLQKHPEIKTVEELKSYVDEDYQRTADYYSPINLNAEPSGQNAAAQKLFTHINNSTASSISIVNEKGKTIKSSNNKDIIAAIGTEGVATKISMNPLDASMDVYITSTADSALGGESYTVKLDANDLKELLTGIIAKGDFSMIDQLAALSGELKKRYESGEEYEEDNDLQTSIKTYIDMIYEKLLTSSYGIDTPLKVSRNG